MALTADKVIGPKPAVQRKVDFRMGSLVVHSDILATFYSAVHVWASS